MNTQKSYSNDLNPSFSMVLKTVESYEFFEQAIALCDNLNRNYDLNEDDRRTVKEVMLRFQQIYNTMNIPNYFSHTKLTPESIKRFNNDYSYIFNLKECSHLLEIPQIELPLVDRLPDKIVQLPYRERVIENIAPSHSGTKILPFVHERISQHERIRTLQNSIFGVHGEILPANTVEKIREKTAKILSTDPISANLYKWDCLAANDEKFPDAELSDDMILHAIKTAKIRKDGAFVQSIKNNLIHRAQEIEKSKLPNIEKSLLLADHIKNLTPENPISMNTITFGKCWVTNVNTIEHGDDVHYELDIVLKNGNKKHINILASSCVVGDLSSELPIRNIESIKSTIIQPRNQSDTFFQKGFQKIKNMFGFGKNK